MTEKQSEEVQQVEVPEEVLALHPIVFQLMQIVVPGPNGEEFDLPDDQALPELRDGVLEYDGDQLRHVAETLTAFVIVMQAQHNSPTLAGKVLAVLQSPEVGAKLKALSISTDPERVQEVAKRFSQFSGAGPKTAPMADAKKPDGAISLDKLNFPRRM